jgi:cytidylate kinase
MTLSREILLKQNAETSNAIIEHWKDNDQFLALAQKEGDLTIQRDMEDGVKLQKGIDFAKEKGVIDPNYVPEPYIEVDVLGKTPSTVADEILGIIEKDNNAAGSVIVLCGLSGTGKGTTVSKLRQKLEQDQGKKVVSWSNGNIFRSVTLLAVTWCEQQPDSDGSFEKDKALTKENLASFMSMLSFGKFNGKYDTRIQGLGLDMLVSEVQNTELKSPKVSKNIPTVAEVTQGEVIIFAAKAVETMGQDGLFVLLEGREQTVNYVRTPYRFTLVLSDESLIGKRRAAQRVMAAALSELSENATEEDVGKALDKCLKEMVAE